MRIDELYSYLTNNSSAGSAAESSDVEVSFQRILADVVANQTTEGSSSETEETQSTAGIGGPPTGPAPLMGPPPSGETDEDEYEYSAESEIADQTGSLLGALDDFAEMLGNWDSNVTNMEPQMQRIGEMADDLENSLDQWADSDQELSDLAREVVARGRAEVMKFQRGDYV